MIYIKHHLFSDYCESNLICMKQVTMIFNTVQRKDRWNLWIYCHDSETCITQLNESLLSSCIVLCCQISLTACAKPPQLKEQTAPYSEQGHWSHRGNNELCTYLPGKQKRHSVKNKVFQNRELCYQPYSYAVVVRVKTNWRLKTY